MLCVTALRTRLRVCTGVLMKPLSTARHSASASISTAQHQLIVSLRTTSSFRCRSVIVYEGQPSREATATCPQSLLTGEAGCLPLLAVAAFCILRHARARHRCLPACLLLYILPPSSNRWQAGTRV